MASDFEFTENDDAKKRKKRKKDLVAKKKRTAPAPDRKTAKILANIYRVPPSRKVD